MSMWTINVPSPIGELRAFATDNGLRALLLPGSREAPLEADPGHAHAMLLHVRRQLMDYFDGKRQVFDLPLDAIGTEFQQLAWHALRAIPFGETRSYGQQAAAIGRPKSVRAIGSANARNPIPIIVPCHRVIGADGSLTGFAGGLDAKRTLLQHEASVIAMA